METIKLDDFRKNEDSTELKEIRIGKYNVLVSINNLGERYKNNLEKLTHNIIKKLSNNRLFNLEEALNQEVREKPRIIDISEYLRTDSGKYGKRAVVNYVTLSTLPHGDGWQVLGLYDPSSHTMYVARDMPIAQVNHTKRHEDIHSFGERDEILTDRLASNDVSYGIMSAAA